MISIHSPQAMAALVQDDVLNASSGLHCYVPLDFPGSLRVQGPAIFDKHVRIGGDARFEGPVHCTGHCAAGGKIHLRGSGYFAHAVDAGGALESTRNIESGLWIRAGGRIKTVGSLTAAGSIRGESISAGECIESQKEIVATEDIVAGWWVYSYAFHIECKTLKSKRLPLGREFWAALPALKKWREEILNSDLCWEDWLPLISQEERAGIVNSLGLHWSLTGQMSNYLGVSEFVTPPKCHEQ